MKTRDELIAQVLDELGVVATGQPIAPEDAGVVDGLLDAALATLAADRIVYVGDPGQIEDAIFLPLATAVAESCRRPFAVAQPTDADIANARATLRRMNAGRPTYARQTAEYF